jgi:GrpB-like predicted nucleotidyltransferase (UPF0157 family)
VVERLEPRSAPPGGRIVLAEPDDAWPRLYAEQEHRIRASLGPAALRIDHVGSTSVPGLAAKPILDISLVVADPADEPAYVPALEAAGYRLALREPDWFEHRLLRGAEPAVNLHVFGPGCAEVEAMLLFRDTLRSRPEELVAYLTAKRELAERTWEFTQDYADAKSEVVAAILARARRGYVD